MLRSFAHSDFSVEALVAAKSVEVTVCIPAREIAGRIGSTVGWLVPLRERGLIDQLLVVDADSADGTAEVARSAGAEVRAESELLAGFGPVLGKGDAMWRALAVAGGEVVAYLDGDISDSGPHYLIGLLGPLLTRGELDFVKGHYRRPFSFEGGEIPDGGGRVTELTARPLLARVAPELAAFHQPLAGELAARRELLEEIPFTTSYGVEIAMLAEVYSRTGLSRMSQVDLGTKRNDHQPLPELGEMARDVVDALAGALDRNGAPGLGSIPATEGHRPRLVTRPPIASALAGA